MKIRAIFAFIATALLLASPASAQDWSGVSTNTVFGSELSACAATTSYASINANNARNSAQRQFPDRPIFVHLSACKCEASGNAFKCMVRWELTNWRRGDPDD